MKRACFTIAVLILILHSNFAVAEVSSAAQQVLATIEWISIPEGTFLMGSTPEEAKFAYEDAKLRSSMLDQHTFDAELPRHQVYLSTYEISRYEITNAQYRAFIEATNRPSPRGHNGEETWADETLNGDTQPVVGVTWFDAQAFAEWIGGSLPTEAQWERAARGAEGRTYPWGNTPPKARQHANFARRYNRPMPVGSRKVNLRTVLRTLPEMSGNGASMNTIQLSICNTRVKPPKIHSISDSEMFYAQGSFEAARGTRGERFSVQVYDLNFILWIQHIQSDFGSFVRVQH